MRSVILAVGLLALLWSGYWIHGSRGTTQAVRDWFSARDAGGWQAEVAGIRTRGFPSRFDTTLTAPRLSAPGGSVVWTAPFLQILRLSYKPEHAILVFPDRQDVTLAGAPVAISSARMRASAVFDRTRHWGLGRANLVAEGLSVAAGEAGLSADEALAAIRRAAALPTGYDLALELRGVALGGTAAPLRLDRVSLDATMRLGAALDGRAIEAARLAPESLDLRRFQLQAGALEVTARSTLTFDRTGLPSGTVTVQSNDWPAALRLAKNMHLPAPDQLPEEPDELTIDIRRGEISFAPSPR